MVVSIRKAAVLVFAVVTILAAYLYVSAHTAELQRQHQVISNEAAAKTIEIQRLRAQVEAAKRLHMPALPSNYNDRPQIAAHPSGNQCRLGNTTWWWRDIAHAASEVAVNGLVVFTSYIDSEAAAMGGYVGLDMVRNWATHIEKNLEMMPIIVCSQAHCDLLHRVGVRARFVVDPAQRPVTHVKWQVAITLVQLGYTAFFLDVDLGFFRNPFVGPNRIKTLAHNPSEAIPDIQVISDYFDGSTGFGEPTFPEEEYWRRVQYWNATNYSQDKLRTHVGEPPSCVWFNLYSCFAFPSFCVGASFWIIQPTIASARYLTELIVNLVSNPGLHEQQNMNILLDYHLKLGLTMELLPGYLYANVPALHTHSRYSGKSFEEFGAVMLHGGYSLNKQYELRRAGLWLLECGLFDEQRHDTKPCQYNRDR